MAETFTGEVRNGVVVLDAGTPPLPEGARLRIEVETGSDAPRRKSLAERYAPIVGIAEGLPADMAGEHDHYIHGTPRRGEG